MRVAVLLSGGVDSALALKLLVDAGHQCQAYYLKIWLEDELSFLGECPWEEDLAYARASCEQLGVPLKIIPLQKEYHERVVGYTIDELKAGRTPSPDIFCNQRIKFGAFLDEIGEELVASGHYARIIKHGGQTLLGMAPDPVKDQTYFLAHLSASQLARIVFPIGELAKEDVRRLARESRLPPAERKDSQGICFLGRIKFREFAEAHLGVKPGAIIERQTGKILGEHSGYWFHTIGQRTGLGLSGGPWYVVGKDLEQNIIEVVHQADYRLAELNEFRVTDLHWINQPPRPDERLECKLRHGPKLFECSLELDGSSGRARLLDGSDSGLAPGQFAVFYQERICLGLGRIALS